MSSLPVTLQASSVTQPVSGTVAVSNFPATQPVSGSVSTTNTYLPLKFEHAVTLGLVPGYSIFRRFGSNPDIDTGATENVWRAGGTLVYPTTATVISVASSSPNDTAGGSGARTVFVTYLDASYVQQTTTLTLNGVTPVTSAGTAIRLISCYVATAGSGNANAGTITVTIDGKTQAAFDAGFKQTEIAFYTVPAGKQAIPISFQGGVRSNDCELTFEFRPFGGVFRPWGNIESGLGTHYQEVTGVLFTEKTDLRVTAQTTNNNQVVFCEYTLLIVG